MASLCTLVNKTTTTSLRFHSVCEEELDNLLAKFLTASRLCDQNAVIDFLFDARV